MKRKFDIVSIIGATNIILGVISVTMSIVLYEVGKEGIKQQEIEIVNKSTQNYLNRIDALFLKFSELSFSISTSNETAKLRNYSYDKAGDIYGKVQALNDFDKKLENYLLFNSCVTNVAAKFSDVEEYSYGIRHLAKSSSTEEMDYVLNNFNFFSYSIKLQSYNEKLYYLYSDSENEEFKIIVELDDQQFINFFDLETNLTTSFGKGFFVNDKFIYSISNYDVPFEVIMNENFDNLLNAKSYIKYQVYNDVFVFRFSIDLTNIKNRGIIPIVYLIIGVILILTVSILSFVTTINYLKKPIKELKIGMKEVSKGNFCYKLNIKVNTDFKELIDGFNSMTQLLNTYIEEKYLNEIRVKDANFKVLQSQIHPHFLYNCFATIQSLLSLEEYDKAKELSKELSLYYSYITKNKNILVCLKEERDHMNRYLKIQKIRFGDSVKYDIDQLDEKFFEYKVPKIIFQPIVENSFKYSFKNIDNGQLKISISEDDTYLKISFEDNGTITDEKIEELNNKIFDQNIEISGLINVIQRILNYSQKTSSVEISKGTDLKGLNVTFKLKKVI